MTTNDKSFNWIESESSTSKEARQTKTSEFFTLMSLTPGHSQKCNAHVSSSGRGLDFEQIAEVVTSKTKAVPQGVFFATLLAAIHDFRKSRHSCFCGAHSSAFATSPRASSGVLQAGLLISLLISAGHR